MTRTTPKTAPAKILVVDDDPQLRRAFHAILASQGCAVIEAQDGNEAIEQIKADCPDLVLLDINIPGIDGFETCRQIRAFSEVPIIVVTARRDEKDKIIALDAGADDYIVKPFGTQEFLARIRGVVRGVHGLEEIPPFNSAGLKIDFEHRRVIASGRPVHLTPMEFELLEHLVENRGKPVSYLKLICLFGGPEHSSDHEPLRSLIGQLRKKIEADTDQPRYIHTEPLVGYRFDPDYGTPSKAGS